MSSDGRKIPRNLENPIDNLCLKLIERIHVYFKSMGFTPNGITYLSGILQFIALFYFYNKKYILAGILYFIGYFFDVMDGWYARYYKMTSSYGDLLDHIKDTIVVILIYVLALFLPVNKKWKASFIFVSFILFIVNVYFISCQEAYYDKQHESGFYSHVNDLCTKENSEKKLSKLRYGAVGTFALNISIFLILLHFIENKK
jgi:phosphatidylglycerophosphate synthase